MKRNSKLFAIRFKEYNPDAVEAGAVVAGVYCHTRELLRLNQCPSLTRLPEDLRVVKTPLVVEAWAEALRGPQTASTWDTLFRGSIMDSISVTGENTPCSRQRFSATDPTDGERLLRKERQAGLGPSGSGGGPLSAHQLFRGHSQPALTLEVAPDSGSVPPSGASVNDGVSCELRSFTYVSVDDATRLVLDSGPGAILAKVDVQSAYRNVPVPPDDRLLLGMKWDEKVFVDAVWPPIGPENF